MMLCMRLDDDVVAISQATHPLCLFQVRRVGSPDYVMSCEVVARGISLSECCFLELLQRVVLELLYSFSDDVYLLLLVVQMCVFV